MTARVRMTKEPCSQCPWTGNCPGLRSGRLKELREQTLRKGGTFICHKTMLANDGSKAVYGEGEDGAAVCSGWANALPQDWPAELQIADRLGFILRIDAPEID